MKHLLAIIALAATIAAGNAQTFLSGKPVSTNMVYGVVPPGHSADSIIYSLHSSVDGTLGFFYCDSAVTVTNALAAGMSNVLCPTAISGTAVFAAEDTILLYDLDGDRWQWAQINNTNTTGMLLTNSAYSRALTTDFPLTVGDMVFRMRPTGGATATTIPRTRVAVNAGAPSSITGSRVLTAGGSHPALVDLRAGAGTITNISLVVSGRR
jgi:predicted carbohydrate-binding protein with CBM5 and CBM33 domain